MKLKSRVLIKCFVLLCYFNSCIAAVDESVKLIEDEGYICDIHRVETKDGYIIKMHRVLKKGQEEMPKLGVVLLMHGLYATSADFLVTGSKIAIVYYLVDNGYDVWLGNSRGSKYGMKHKTLKVKTKQFWNFSWHEIGIYDLPAMIDYILKATNKEKIFYIGHSQGVTAMMVLLSLIPEYNDRIIQAHMLTPPIFMSNFPNTFIRSFGTEILNSFVRSGMYQSFPVMSIVEKLGALFCTESFPPTLSMCTNMVQAIAGVNQYEVEIDTSILSYLVKNFSPQISIMQVIHFGQSMTTGKFSQYDHKDKNMKFYNSTSPPEYDLNNVKAPMYLYVGEDDALVSALDVEILKTKLPNIREYQVVNNYNHMDFNYGKNSRTVVYTDILKSFNNEGMPEKNVSSTMYDEE